MAQNLALAPGLNTDIGNETANINIKKNFLSTVLIAKDQKQQKL